MSLESHQVENTFCCIVLAQLHHGVWFLSGSGICQSHRLQRAKAQGIDSPAGHYLYRHTAFKNIPVLKAVNLRLLGGGKLLNKGQVLFLVHGAVDIIRGSPVIPGLPPGQVHVNGFRGHQRCCSVKEMQVTGLAKILADGPGKGIRGKRAGCNNYRAFRHLGHLFLHYTDSGMTPDFLRYHPGKTLSVHRKAASGLYPCCFRTGQNQAAAAAQFLFQKANRVLQPVSAQRVGANQLRKIHTVVGRRHFVGLHFVKLDLKSPLGQLPGRLRTGKACADYFHRHAQAPFFFPADFVVVFFAVVLAAVFLAAVFFGGAFFGSSFCVSAVLSAGSDADSFFL